MRIHLEPVRLKLKESFAIAHGTYDYRDSLIVGIEENGKTGWGEATAISYYGYSLDDLRRTAKRLASVWQGEHFPGVMKFYRENSKLVEGDSFVLSAFDCAAHDLAARSAGLPWSTYRGIDVSTPAPPTSHTVSAGTREGMIDAIHHRADWPVLKLKSTAAVNISEIEDLLHQSPVPLRIDANGSWSFELLKQVLGVEEKESHFLELLEQPLSPGDDERLKQLNDRAVPVIADESFSGEGDFKKVQKSYDGVNIKLMKCGGLTPAMALIRKAKGKGLRVMIGCMTESSFGISAAAQLATLCDYVDLDGALLIENDPAQGIEIGPEGVIQLSEKPGFGTKWKV